MAVLALKKIAVIYESGELEVLCRESVPTQQTLLDEVLIWVNEFGLNRTEWCTRRDRRSISVNGSEYSGWKDRCTKMNLSEKLNALV